MKIEIDQATVDFILEAEDAVGETPKTQKTIVEDWINEKLAEIIEEELS